MWLPSRRAGGGIVSPAAALLLGGLPTSAAFTQEPTSATRLDLGAGDRIVFIGNTFAERMSLFPHFEAQITALAPDARLTFRNLGWSGDEITLMPRPLNFGDMHVHLEEQRADVIFAFFGMNESFAGAAGLPSFREDLRNFLQEQRDRGTSSRPRAAGLKSSRSNLISAATAEIRTTRAGGAQLPSGLLPGGRVAIAASSARTRARSASGSSSTSSTSSSRIAAEPSGPARRWSSSSRTWTRCRTTC